MAELERKQIESLLSSLEARDALFPEFALTHRESGLHLLGRGGFSVVYEMYAHSNPQARYALKVTGFQQFLSDSEEFRATTRVQRFLMEQSPYVVRILEAKELWIQLSEHGDLCAVWESAPEENVRALQLQLVLMDCLEPVIGRNRFGRVFLEHPQLSQEAEVLKLGMQIGQTLLCAHKNQILHRDIKLENIFYDPGDNCYKLGDFGAAKITQDGSAQTAIFTNGYGAPEISRRLTDRYDAAADIYSLGITLYLLLNGLKFPGSDGYHTSQVQYHPDFIFPAPENASEAVTLVLQKMCSYHKADRYGSMGEVLAALSAAAEAAIPEAEIAPWMDVPTETYRESPEGSSDSLLVTHKDSRASRLLPLRMQQFARRKDGALHFCLFLALFCLAMPALSQTVPPLSQWQYWLLPGALIMNAAFLFLGDLKHLAGFAAAGLILFSAVQTELTVLHLLGLLYTAAAMPVPMAALACAIGLQTAIPMAPAWMVWLADHNAGWVMLVPLMALSHRSAILRPEKKPKSMVVYRAGYSVIILLPYLLAGMGIVLRLLDWFGVWTAPDALQAIHPVKTGIFSFILFTFQYSHWGLADDEPPEEGDEL